MKKAASNQLEDVLKIVYFDIYAWKILEKYMWKSSFFIVVTKFKPATLLKKNSDKDIC